MPSKPNTSTVPLAFGTSSQIQMCGFVQSTCFTVPVTVFWLEVSNAANEWWAAAETPANRIVAATTSSFMTRPLLSLRCRASASRNREIDAGLARRIHRIAIVLLADVLGNRPVAMTLQRVVRDVRRGERVGVGDGRLDRHRVGNGEAEALEDLPWHGVRES